ncbi:MAG TPA: rhodanese-like domain-containing protein [Thiopseudomonas sp.]|nr:rhodanese-like domain-containing protein [Thiopseudomonas sp.]
MLKFIYAALIVISLPLTATHSYAQQNTLFNAEGYRSSVYRSPTPTFHEQAQTIEPNELVDMQEQYPNLLLIDVYRNPWLRGHFTLTEEHKNLPNSLWLANCGDGSLSQQWLAYCQNHLEQATAGNTSQPIVFYCRSDCWLGWNAIKRAHAFGYSNLYWLRDGIDGWEQADLPLEHAQPAPLH